MKLKDNIQKTQRNTPTTINPPHPTSVVMDVLPWPDGSGFSGGDNWWRLVLSQTECERLNSLVGLALLDSGICERLVTMRDPTLFAAFGLSERTQEWLRGIKATTLKELAQAIVEATRPVYLYSASIAAA